MNTSRTLASGRCAVALILFVTTLSSLRAAETPALPDWTELQTLVRSNLTGLNGEELNRALVLGLLHGLKGEVVLVGKEAESSSGPALARADLYEDAFAYLRVARVEPGLEKQVADALDRLGATNKLQGVVLDLRFATGSDYAVVAQVADRFVARELALLDWGEKMARSTVKTNDVSVPVAVVVNAQTSGAPEALAAVLRESNVGLVLGATTSGRANVFREFSLSNGQKIRIAAAKVRLGNGEVIPAGGVRPDVEVAVKPADEQVYFEDPWRVLARVAPPTSTVAAAATNSAFRRVNEAELMRQRREELGDREVEPPRARATALSKPVLQDPALARAMDLLKGLAIVRQGKSHRP